MDGLRRGSDPVRMDRRPEAARWRELLSLAADYAPRRLELVDQKSRPRHQTDRRRTHVTGRPGPCGGGARGRTLGNRLRRIGRHGHTAGSAGCTCRYARSRRIFPHARPKEPVADLLPPPDSQATGDALTPLEEHSQSVAAWRAFSLTCLTRLRLGVRAQKPNLKNNAGQEHHTPSTTNHASAITPTRSCQAASTYSHK